MSRIWALTGYLWRELFRSLTGFLAIVASLVFYLVAILSVTGRIDRDYFALVIGGFFGVFCLVLTIIVADRAFHAKSYLVLYRIPARSIFLVSISLTATLATALLEAIIALASLIKLSTPLTFPMVMDILPVWIGWLILGSVLGLHMSELVRRGWSRTVVYALLAFILFALNQQQSGIPVSLSDRFNWIPSLTPDPIDWGWAYDLVNVIIWPVSAGVRVARSSSYSIAESLSPAVVLFTATAIYCIAAYLFKGKDLILPED
ncbi:MAG: hypothetical protein JXA42_13690 [Anaerolineales bacterium]|nr:hypothetical protein [Anaerolineales bacterium]